MTGSSSGPVRRPVGRWRSACRSRPPALSGPSGGRASVARVRARDRRPGRGRRPARSACWRRSSRPRWAEVAERCLACTNCTLVCPTCFCTSVSQRSDLDGQTRDRPNGAGTPASRSSSRKRRRRQLPAATRGPLPAVADPQVRDVDRPVRQRPAALAAAAASPGARSGSTSARSCGDRQPAAAPAIRSRRPPPGAAPGALCDRARIERDRGARPPTRPRCVVAGRPADRGRRGPASS